MLKALGSHGTEEPEKRGWKSIFQNMPATITGTVMDTTGALAPNATVTVTSVNTNVKRTTESNKAGNYTVAQLNEGTYALTSQVAGFRELVAQNIVIPARDVRRVAVRLEVGAVEIGAIRASGFHS